MVCGGGDAYIPFEPEAANLTVKQPFQLLGGLSVGLQVTIDLAGDGSFEAAFHVAAALAFGGASGRVGLRRRVVLQPR